jgi:acyl carrier protein
MHRDIQEFVVSRVGDYDGRRPESIDADRPLADYGLDSVSALTLCGDLEDRYRITLEPTVAREYPTVNAIAAFVAERIVAGPR